MLIDDVVCVFLSRTLRGQVEKVRMLERFTAVEPAPGTLYLTATHLIFVDPRNKKETWVRGTGPGAGRPLPG